MDLKEWVVNFIRSRASFEVEESFVDVVDDEIVVRKDSGERRFLVRDDLDESVVEDIKNYDKKNVVIVALNKRSNVDWLVGHWKDLICFPLLSFMFVNPVTFERWVVFPKTHDLITEKASLKKGLISLFENVSKV